MPDIITGPIIGCATARPVSKTTISRLEIAQFYNETLGNVVTVPKEEINEKTNYFLEYLAIS